jgi:hypothetical protein
MWDDARKVGILNDFDLAKFADQTGASGQDNTGTLPFMALDLLSEEGLRGEIPRRYRHEAESFAWSLICLYFATVEDENGGNRTRDPHPLIEWFQDWNVSHHFKKGLNWHKHDRSDIPLAFPNTKALASALHNYWLDRYSEQFPHPSERKVRPRPPLGTLNVPASTIANSPYKEPEDDRVFLDLLTEHEDALVIQPLEGLWKGLTHEFTIQAGQLGRLDTSLFLLVDSRAFNLPMRRFKRVLSVWCAWDAHVGAIRPT